MFKSQYFGRSNLLLYECLLNHQIFLFLNYCTDSFLLKFMQKSVHSMAIFKELIFFMSILVRPKDSKLPGLIFVSILKVFSVVFCSDLVLLCPEQCVTPQIRLCKILTDADFHFMETQLLNYWQWLLESDCWVCNLFLYLKKTKNKKHIYIYIYQKIINGFVSDLFLTVDMQL